MYIDKCWLIYINPYGRKIRLNSKIKLALVFINRNQTGFLVVQLNGSVHIPNFWAVAGSLILGGWVAKVLKNGNKKWGGGRKGPQQYFDFLVPLN